jgi:hypothetical protein
MVLHTGILSFSKVLRVTRDFASSSVVRSLMSHTVVALSDLLINFVLEKKKK